VSRSERFAAWTERVRRGMRAVLVTWKVVKRVKA
jgi:hypothetical protein